VLLERVSGIRILCAAPLAATPTMLLLGQDLISLPHAYTYSLAGGSSAYAEAAAIIVLRALAVPSDQALEGLDFSMEWRASYKPRWSCPLI